MNHLVMIQHRLHSTSCCKLHREMLSLLLLALSVGLALSGKPMLPPHARVSSFGAREVVSNKTAEPPDL